MIVVGLGKRVGMVRLDGFNMRWDGGIKAVG